MQVKTPHWKKPFEEVLELFVSDLSLRKKIPYSVHLIAAESGAIEARGGMSLHLDFHCSPRPRIDILIVPGGHIERELERDELFRWIRSLSHSAETIASVCTEAFILAKSGLLEGLSATTHWEDIEEFSQMFPKVKVIANNWYSPTAHQPSYSPKALMIHACLSVAFLPLPTARRLRVTQA
jgi:transcriptional regulator GlxA family with amidase domain